MRSFRPLLGLNVSTLRALISMAFPVWGFRPRRDSFWRIRKCPKPTIFTANRQASDWYTLFPNPVVAESLLDRLINNSHQILMNGASYRPHKRPGRVVPQDTTTPR